VPELIKFTDDPAVAIVVGAPLMTGDHVSAPIGF
jgi:hypothetical protein